MIRTCDNGHPPARVLSGTPCRECGAVPCAYGCGKLVTAETVVAAHVVDGRPGLGWMPSCPACNQAAKSSAGGGGRPQAGRGGALPAPRLPQPRPGFRVLWPLTAGRLLHRRVRSCFLGGKGLRFRKGFPQLGSSMTEMAATARRRLHERALEQYGYITTRDAAELGVRLNALHVMANRGGLTRVAHGVYRFDDVPASGRDSYMEAVLAVGEGAFLYADAVLAIRDLALVNPARLRVGTPKRRDKRLPPTIEMVVVDVPPADREVYEGIPCTTVARALVDSIGIVMPERLLDAARDAAERGLMRRMEAASVIARLGGETPWPTNPAT